MTDTTNHRPPDGLADRSTADLVKLAAEQISTLVRDELKLAQAELTGKVKHAGIGIGLFGASGVLAMYGVAGVLVTIVLALALVMPAWLASLIVTVVILVVCGVLALVGRAQVGKAGPAMPSDVVRNVKADVEAVKDAVQSRGQR